MKSHLLRVFVLFLTSCTFGFAANRTYPVSEVNFGAYNTTYNLNVTGLGAGSPLNIYSPTGNENEDWRINYISDGVFEIENSTTGAFITAGANNVAQIATQVNNTTQRWQIVGVAKDFLGAFLYYKIINVGNGKALTYSGTTVVLADYVTGNNQLWRLDLDGLEGFGALCKVNEGLKASTIGGLLGQTVFVSNLTDLRAALGNAKPLTIVLTANLDCVKEGSDMRIDNYKTLIGSFAANTLTDARFTTNYYGWSNPPANPGPPSDNIVVKNLTFPVIGREDVIVFQFYSGKNLWVDHCTFYSTLKKAADEVGKFIWINTPSAGPDITRNPDFITLSYNILRNRYWCVAYGTQNTTTSEDRTTVAFNIWDSNVRRTPQIGNGSMHTYNNFNVNNSSSVENAGYANVIPGDGSFVYAEANRFENFKKESSGYWDEEYVVGSTPFKDNGSYTNRSESGAASVVPYLWSTTKTLPTLSWNPRTNYGYKVLKAYNSSAANDAKAFNQKYSGSQSTMSNFKYITDTDMSTFVAETVKNPFLITTRTTPKTYVYQYNTTAANDAWESTSNWTPSEVPTAIDTAIIRTGEVKVSSDLGTFVRVEPNGIFRLIGTYNVPSIELQGGTLKVFTSSTIYGLTSNIEVQKASTIMAGSLAASIFWLKGTLSGNENLIKTSIGILDLNVDATSYTGNWLVSEGVLRIANTKSISKNTVTVSAGATLEIAAANVAISKVILGTGILNLTINLSANEFSIKGIALAPGKYTASNYPGIITGTGTLTVLGVPDCFGVLNGTATLDNCSRCIGGTTVKTACTSSGEAETEACTFDGITETKNAGFKGTSYLNVDNAVGTSITFNITATNAGTATLSFRYANGGTVDRPAQISVNGTVLANNLSFPVTGTFTEWKSVDLTLTLLKGNNNMKIISYTSEGLPNIDQIGYVSAGVSKGSCVITGTLNLELETLNYEVYPNPFINQFTIQSKGDFKYQILDVKGLVLHSGEATNSKSISEELPQGIYLLKIENASGKRVIKMVKN